MLKLRIDRCITRLESLTTTVISVTLLFIISILFRRVTVNVLDFVLRVVFFFSSNCVYCNEVHVRCCASDALSASFALECFDGSEVTTKRR